ncbi:MAG: methylated-DNA--[protein]-cysteine S-methyltransferase [Verrucomicrobiota bacterium]
MTDYERIERVICHATEHYREQPNLEELADVSGLSVSRFHRLFNSWAGVTPKQFLKFLTAEDARIRLRTSASVLDTALDVGLSGPGRLHDLFVTVDGATPGELKSGGANLRIEWGFADTSFGQCSLGWTQRGVCHLAFWNTGVVDSTPPNLLKDWPHAEIRRSDDQAATLCKRIFVEPGMPNEPLQLWVRGTAFQLKVWQALLRIPEGRLCSYGQIAKAIGHPRASRAVGTACGSNPVGYLIPCHRVIRETGIVDGYRWGSPRKKAILAKEAALCAR